jgi:hypothetical protein
LLSNMQLTFHTHWYSYSLSPSTMSVFSKLANHLCFISVPSFSRLTSPSAYRKLNDVLIGYTHSHRASWGSRHGTSTSLEAQVVTTEHGRVHTRSATTTPVQDPPPCSKQTAIWQCRGSNALVCELYHQLLNNSSTMAILALHLHVQAPRRVLADRQSFHL